MARTGGHSTILDLDNDIREMTQKSFKRTPEEVRKLQKQIEVYEYQNKRVDYERKKLKKEQISRGTKKSRVKEIDLILKGMKPITIEVPKAVQKKYGKKKFSDLYLIKIPLEGLKNDLSMISGKDFFVKIDDGLSKPDHVKFSTLKKMVKKGQSISERYLNKFEKGVKSLLSKTKRDYEKNKSTLTAGAKKKKLNQIKGLTKLLEVTNFNKEAYKSGDLDYEHLGDDVEQGEYPIVYLQVGNTIRINA